MSEEEGLTPSPARNIQHNVRITCTTHTTSEPITFKNKRKGIGNDDGKEGVVLRRRAGDDIGGLLRLIELMLSRRLRNPFKKIITLRFQSAINGAGKLVLKR